MSDILDTSALDPVLSAVVERLYKLHISALTISLVGNDKRVRVSALTTDGRCHYAVKTTSGNMQWVSYDTGERSD